MKKLQRRAKQSEQNNNDKDDKDDKSESGKKESSGDGSFGGLTPIDSLDSPYATTPKSSMPFSPEGESYTAHSGDSFCGSDVSLDDSRMDQFDDHSEMSSTQSHSQVPSSQVTPPGSQTGVQSQSSSDGGGLVGVYPQINPIDKLYLMHNSYFDH
ncbi:UNVERIFIED_CONTAM: hypothetical protein RMT77_005841 [Armadillidium vulgare]